ncbi:hypothetical protein [Lactiplantibacillus xiangfangensis]|jgi:predicted PurR-regulated permease PerM|nr:hypothetical protein [Lactiplantibacillus xiangfangensis]
MRRQLATRQRWLVIILLTIVGIGCALFGRWGQLLSVILIGLTLTIVTSSCLNFCQSRGFKQGSGMLLSLIIVAGYILVILGSYGYLKG